MSSGLLRQTLDSLAPAQEDLPAWEEVLARAGIETAPPVRRPLWKRSWIVAAAALIAVLVPLAAIGSEQDWWFFAEEGMAPKPVTDVVVVKAGSWDGKRWELIAFRSDTEGLCYGVQTAGFGTTFHNGPGSALACGPMAGVPGRSASSSSTSTSTSISISSLSSSLGARSEDTPYAAGPVSDRAAQVDIYLRDGQVVHTPTFAAPDELGAPVRFYATQLPPNTAGSISTLVGLDGAGNVVACYVSASAENDLSACE